MNRDKSISKNLKLRSNSGTYKNLEQERGKKEYQNKRNTDKKAKVKAFKIILT